MKIRIALLFAFFSFALSASVVAQNCSITASYTITATGVDVSAVASSNVITPTYSWYDPTTTTYTTASSSSFYSFTLTQPGNYNTCVLMIDSVLQCTDSVCFSFYYPGQTCAVTIAYTVTTTGVVATATSLNTTTPLYSWYDPSLNAWSPFSPTSAYTFQFAQAGYYYTCVTVVDSATQCSDSTCITILYSGAGGCQASFYSFDSLGTTFFVNTSSYDSTNTFLWVFGDSTTATDPDPSHNYNTQSWYTVCLSILDANQQVCDSVCSVVYASSAPQLTVAELAGAATQLILAPNPANDKVTVSWEQRDAGATRIEICDLTGRTLSKQLNTPTAAGRQTVDLAVCQLPGGIYFIQLYPAGQPMARSKLVINRQ